MFFYKTMVLKARKIYMVLIWGVLSNQYCQLLDLDKNETNFNYLFYI
jgi:hypothetical protein